ncbi:MAG: SipW-dependent-type signal peptide-containing protein [Bacillota bacterium]
MKKSRYLALVLVIALMLMGAGYAAWTDQLVINNTLKTGNLEVSFIPELCYGDFYHYLEGDAYEYLREMILDEDYTVNADAISFFIPNMYPGLEMDFNFVMQNLGTIPVTCDGVTVEFKNTDQILKDSIVFNNFTLNVYDANGDYKYTALEWIDDNYYDDVKLNMTGLESYLQQELVGKLKLGVGDRVELTAGDAGDADYWLWLPDSVGNDTENKNLDMSITLSWKQFNQ